MNAHAPVESTSTRWVRPVLLILAVPNIFAGGWAVLAPRSWFDSFPGWAPRLVAAFPPYNEHLTTDAGAGLLTAGVLAALAFAVPRRDVILTAMVGALVFSAPHALFHLAHPAEALSATEDVVNSGSLLGAVGLAAAVFVHVWRQP